MYIVCECVHVCARVQVSEMDEASYSAAVKVNRLQRRRNNLNAAIEQVKVRTAQIGRGGDAHLYPPPRGLWAMGFLESAQTSWTI